MSLTGQRGDSDPLFHRIHALSAYGRQKGRAGLETPAQRQDGRPDGLTVACCFLDRPGWAPRDVQLDCRPLVFVRLELAPNPLDGMIRRTWALVGDDRQGRAVYQELRPEPHWSQAVHAGPAGRKSNQQRRSLEALWDMGEPTKDEDTQQSAE